MGKFVRSDHCRDWDWQLWQEDNGGFGNDQVTHAILMDIRRELRRLNNVIQCTNFIRIPAVLDEIKRNTKKRKRPKPTGKPKLRVVGR